jgi:hypothetical protein
MANFHIEVQSLVQLQTIRRWVEEQQHATVPIQHDYIREDGRDFNMSAVVVHRFQSGRTFEAWFVNRADAQPERP